MPLKFSWKASQLKTNAAKSKCHPNAISYASNVPIFTFEKLVWEIAETIRQQFEHDSRSLVETSINLSTREICNSACEIQNMGSGSLAQPSLPG